jgi:hypothetical protein
MKRRVRRNLRKIQYFYVLVFQTDEVTVSQ